MWFSSSAGAGVAHPVDGLVGIADHVEQLDGLASIGAERGSPPAVGDRVPGREAGTHPDHARRGLTEGPFGTGHEGYE
jgi:hypothetical protein